MSDRPDAAPPVGEQSRQRRDFAQIMRFGVLLAITYIVLGVVLEIGQIYPFPIWPGIILGAAVGVNTTLFFLLSRRVQNVNLLAYLAFAIQALLVTTSVHFLGGIHSLLPVLHIVNIMAAAYVLRIWGGLWAAGVGLSSLAAVWALEYLGWLPLYPLWNGGDVKDYGWIVLANTIVYGVPMAMAAVLVGVIRGRLQEHYRTADEYHRQAEHQLAELRVAQSQAVMESDRLRAILHSTHEGVMLYDPGGKLVLANPMVEKLLTVPGASANPEQVEITSSGSMTSILGQELVLASQDPVIVTHRVLTLEGARTRHVAVDSLPVSGRDERIMGRVFILRDVTDQKELESARDEWTRMLVHDLRSPLISIMGNLEITGELMLEYGDLSAASKGLRMAQRSAQNLLDMVSSLLDISKLEAGKKVLERVSISLPHLAAGVLRNLLPMAQTAQLHLRLDAPHDLPLVIGDREKLHRVFVNLLDNAIKFTPDGGSITIRIEPLGEHVRISVTDTGPGIPEEQHLAIFDRFAQISGAYGRRSGTGLGLTFCKLVVEAHSGRIWVESPPEGGSKFIVTLPCGTLEQERDITRGVRDAS